MTFRDVFGFSHLSISSSDLLATVAMIVRVDPNLTRKMGRVVHLAPTVPRVSKLARFLNDEEVLAFAIRNWTRSGILPPEELDVCVAMAVSRILRRR